ncbi:chymotrypsin-2-like [Cimex lectularius]|uniref:Peptidase S1 domain-containing protein n=1 Tax=Cimex lectularius TaxID=79782 RepID=A0A8I6RJK3_CIMLE|nr:chymotrypsin-2-like [Cimex lectularius]
MCTYRYGQQFKSKALIDLLLFILVLSDCYLTTSGSNGKVIGGRKAVLGEFPATVCLDGIIRCGGTLVSLVTVITAGHCFFLKEKRVNPSDIVIIGGTVDLEEESGDKQYRVNDIALAFLESAFIETKTLKPAFFPASNAAGMREYMDRIKASNATCHGTGYGFVSMEPKIISQYLKVIELSLLPDIVLPELIEYEMCAISNKAFHQTSYGDSGSTFLCGGQIVGLTKGGLGTLPDDEHINVLVFTLLGPYFEDFGLGGCDGMPNFLFLPVVLLCFLFSSFYCSRI